MRAFARLFSVVVLVVLALVSAVSLAGDEVDDKKIAKLIEQLGDDDVDVRKAADKTLSEIGEPALAQLQKAAKSHPDADVRLRAIVLTRLIGRTYFGELRRFSGHTGNIRHIVVSKDGKRMLTASMDYTARVWEIDSGKELLKFAGHGSWVWSIAYAPDEKTVLSSGALDKTLRLWNPQDGKEIRKFEGHTSRVYGAVFSPNGKYALSSGAEMDTSIRLWEVETGKEVRKFDGHTGWVWRVLFSPDGKKIASVGCNDKSFRIWETETGKPLIIGANAHDGFVVGLSFSPDGKHLLTSGRDQTCKLWDVETGKLLKTYTSMADNVEAVAFSKDGKRFLAGENKVVHVFDTETGKIVHRFEDHTDVVYAVAWHPDGRRALSGGADNVVRLWGVPK
jgi:WD40 repeat protein